MLFTPCNQRLKTTEEVEQYFPGFMAFVDCTEQPIPRPKNKKKSGHIIQVKKETCSQKPVCSKSEGDDNLQIQAQTDR
jgi:hypothetical protein